jgi:hypothetical protein
MWLISNNLQIKKGFINIDKTWSSRNLGDCSIFSSFQDIAYYYEPLNYNIYKVMNDKVSIPYTFDLGNSEWPSNARSAREYDNLLQSNRFNNYVNTFYHFQETKNHLIVAFVYQGQYLLGVYDKKNAKTHLAKLSPNQDEYFISFGRIVSMDEKAIYALIEADDMKRSWDGKDEYNDFWKKYSRQIKNLRKKFDHINEEGNPFLVIYYIN